MGGNPRRSELLEALGLTPPPPHCPKCGAAMAFGALGTQAFVGGASWYRERSAFAVGGEPIVQRPLGGMVWIDGHRCPQCRVLLLDY